MRKLFAGLLIANLVFEGVVAIVLILGISPSAEDTLGVNTPWAMDYGFAALVFAGLIFMVWPQRNQFTTASLTLLILGCFHTGLAISTGIASSSGDPVGASIAHASLAAISWLLFFKRHQWCDAQN